MLIKEIIMKNTFLMNMHRMLVEKRSILNAKKNFIEESKIQRDSKVIKVGFLCQYIPAWNKFESIYNYMLHNDNFEPYIFCVPYGIHNNVLDNPEAENDTYEYFINKGYDAINTLVARDEWLNIKNYGLHYIFYTRPYNIFMPKEYHSEILSKYMKICSLMYGISITKDNIKTTINFDFYSNTYCYFAESQETKNYFDNCFKYNIALGYQKAVCCGLPVLSNFISKKNEKSDSWNFSSNSYRVIWTPRWSTDKKSGGSNFFKYHEILLDYADSNKKIDFLFRPHPLMFENFLKTGEMTLDDINTFKNNCIQRSNVQLDTESEYTATFWNSSLLITDLSSVIPEYFLTGKPIMFCVSNMFLKVTDDMEKMMKGMYIIHDENELISCLKMLYKGEDPLKETRIKLIPELFKESMESPENKIAQELLKNSKKN